YERRLLVEDDLTAVTTRNYLSDLRYFTTWCESILKKGRKEKYSFAPETVITTRITGCQINLQQELHLKPIPVNRKLISFKRYFVWQHTRDQIKYAPTKVMKLIVKVVFSPRHLDDQEEQRLIAIVME